MENTRESVNAGCVSVEMSRKSDAVNLRSLEKDDFYCQTFRTDLKFPDHDGSNMNFSSYLSF